MSTVRWHRRMGGELGDDGAAKRVTKKIESNSKQNFGRRRKI